MNDAQIAEELLRLKNNALYLQRRIERLSAALPELSGVSILPSTSVVSETAYDLTPSVGTSPKYARGDHTHGSVAAGGGANHAILSAVHTDSLAAAVARGDLIIGNSTPKWTRLAKGAANEVLKSDGTDPSWANVAYGELTGIPASFTPSIHNVLDSSYHGDVVTNPPVRGGLIVGDYTPKWIRLSPSTQYKVLQIIGVAGDLGWGWVDYSQLTNVPATFTPNAHALLSAYHSDTLTGIPVRGDLLIGNSTPKWAKLGIGTVGKFLKSDGTDPSWQLLPAYPESQTLLADASGVTMTNIGTSYVEVPTSTACRIKTDMALWGQCRLVIRTNKVGSGTQSWKLQYCATDAGAFADLSAIIDDAGAAGYKTLVSAWAAIPAGALGDMIVRLVGKSTTSGDDPVVHVVQLQLKS